MKKIVFLCIALAAVTAVAAQNKKKPSKADLVNQAGDHLMLQLGTDHWSGMPDSINSHTKGLSRGGNIYVMMNRPFKNNPRFGVAFGIGVGTANMYFKNYNIDIKSTAVKLPFMALDSADHFKKYKLSTAYLEVPFEFRFVNDPSKNNKSIKAAIGFKVGTLLNVHTKGKTLENKAGSTVNAFTQKESNKRFFNTTRIAATGRIGLGNFSVYGSYQITALLKDGVGPVIHPFEIGICLSGL